MVLADLAIIAALSVAVHMCLFDALAGGQQGHQVCAPRVCLQTVSLPVVICATENLCSAIPLELWATTRTDGTGASADAAITVVM